MKLRLNIQGKILLSFMAFTFLLLLVVVIFFYFQSLNNIKERAEKNAVRTVKQFKTGLDKSFDNVFAELNGIIGFELERNSVSSPGYEKKLHINIKNFLSVFSSEYSKLILIKLNSNRIFVFSPLRLFNGKISIEEKTENISFLPQTVIKQISDSKKDKQIICNSTIGYKEQILVCPIYKKDDIKIIAFLRTEKIAANTLLNLSLSENESVFLVDKDSRIVFSSEKEMINRLITEVIPKKKLKFTIDTFVGQKDEIIFASEEYSQMGINIFSLTNITSETEKLSNVIEQTIYFSIVIFILLFGLIYFVSGRSSKSLKTITAVAEEIASGNFSHKIEVKRKDEIGTLIDSFNKMADNLQIMFNKLNISNKELEQKINELTTAKIELSEKQRLALIGETVAKISHEIQNKMSGISIWIQNLEMQTAPESPLLLYVKEIKKALSSFMNLLVDFKKFYRRPQLQLVETDIPKLVNNIFDKYLHKIEEKKIIVERLFPENYEVIESDWGMIEETLENILLNAIFFTSKGGKITAELNFEEGKWEIQICNSGDTINIDPLDKIFQPFFTTKSTGSGLGLTICKNAVEAHGGKLFVYNKENYGVCFKIILPKTTDVNK